MLNILDTSVCKRQGGRGREEEEKKKRWERREERGRQEEMIENQDSNIIIHIYMSCENGDISIHFCSYGYRHTSENKQMLNCFSSIRLT